MRAKQLVKGKVEYKEGFSEEGAYEYSPKVDEMYLKKGKVTSLADGTSNKGLFEYIQKLESFCLVEGVYSDEQGTCEGKWQYIPQLKTMEVRLSRAFLLIAKRAFTFTCFLCIKVFGRDKALEGWANNDWDVGVWGNRTGKGMLFY